MDRAQIEAYFDDPKRQEQLVQAISRLVRIRSVREDAQPGMPFGPGPAAALAEGLALAKELGLATHNADNYIGWAELPGTGGKQVATITHLDVVPQGNGWTAAPFDMQVKDGWLIGRGEAPACCACTP